MAKIHALQYFAVLTKSGSMREAASRLDIHPNVLARNIEQLEYYMDAPLIERSPLGIRLTAAGELLAAKLDRTINELDHVGRLIDDLKGLRRGVVSIHAAEGVASALLLPVITSFSTKYTGIGFKVIVGTAKDAVRALEAAACDIALTFFAPKSSTVDVTKRIRLPQFIISRPDHPVTALDGTDLRLLGTYDWVLPSSDFGVRASMDRASLAAGRRILPKFEVSSLDVQKKLILHSNVLGVLPEEAITEEKAAGMLVSVPFPAAMTIDTSLDLCVARDRQPSFAADRFRRELENALDRISASNTKSGSLNAQFRRSQNTES